MPLALRASLREILPTCGLLADFACIIADYAQALAPPAIITPPEHIPLNYPVAVTTSSDMIFVTDTSLHSVLCFNRDGSFVRTFGSTGSPDQILSHPKGILFVNDSLYVADYANRRICVFGMDGSFQSSFSVNYFPLGLAFGEGLLFVSDFHNNHIAAYRLDGTLVRKFGDRKALNNPAGLTYHEGLVFVANQSGGYVSVFRSDGSHLRQIGTLGSVPGRLMAPNGVGIIDGQVFVTSYATHTVSVFSLDGSFVRTIGSFKGSGPDQFKYPMGIACMDRWVLVADSGNNRIRSIHLPQALAYRTHASFCRLGSHSTPMSDSAFEDAFDEEPVNHNGPGFLASHNVISSSDLNLHQLIDRSGTGIGRFNRQMSVTAADLNERHADTILSDEKAKVATIEDSMQKCQSLTEAMMGLLSTFERKLDSLESTMLPVHDKTHSLTTAQKNIESTLTEIEVVLTYNQIAHERDEEIAARNVRSDPTRYIEWVARTNQALSFFQKNMNWKNSDRLIKRLRELNDKGVGEVRAEFARVLKNHEKAVDLKATNWVFPREFELIAPEYVDKLSQLAACLEASGKTDFDRILVGSRATAFKTSLKYLVNVHDASTAAGGGAGDPDGDMAMQQLGRYKRGSHFTIFFTNYTCLLLELENLLLGKILRLSTKLQPVDLYNFFVEIADPPIEYMCKKNEGVTRDKSPNKILILLDVLQHLKYMLPKFHQLLKRSNQPSQPLSRIINLKDLYTSSIEKALKAYREYVTTYTPPKQSSSVKQLSREGTIFTLTIETLNFIKHLFEYREAVIDVGGSVSGVPGSHDDDTPVRPSSNPAQSRPVSALDGARSEPASLVGKIIVNILSGLNQNLEAKAKTYKDPALAAIFLLNNFHYIAKQIRATFSYSFQYPLTEEKSDKAPASLLKEVGEGFVIKNYDQAVRKARADYARCWDKAKLFLSVDEGREFVQMYNEKNPLGAAEVRTSGNASVSDKEVPSNIRKMIKSKFAGFNTVFEELYNTQRVYSVPDSDFRSQLRNDNVELVIPMYKHFLDQYAHIPFSTHPRDYHKYDVVTLEGMLNQFFDESYVNDA